MPRSIRGILITVATTAAALWIINSVPALRRLTKQA